jgi:hypothetical protein
MDLSVCTELSVTRQNKKFSVTEASEGRNMSLQEAASQVGRRATKFCPANVQKIKDWVAEGISREEIAKSLDVTVGSLQVTCSRLGISLRMPKMFERRRRVESRPYLPNHPPMVGHIGPKPQYLRFQIILEHDGLQRVTDVPLAGLDIARVALEAEAQNLGMTQLLTQAVTTAIKKDMIEKVLREPSPDHAPQAVPESP